MADAAIEGGSASVEADLNTLLSSPSFSVASYLNLALSAGGSALSPTTPIHAPDELQQKMAGLALQLQIQTQSCHEDIGRIGAELQAILPRCAADVGRVGVGLEGMKMDAKTLLETTSTGDAGISSSLETLSTLHALQANLSKTKTVLTAAATWDSTIGSVAPLLAEQNLTEAVHALAQLEAGETALQGMPHREERQKSIQEIRDQVQALLQPQLQHALQNMHTRLAPLQQCVSLYGKLDKMDSLREDYVKQRPGAVRKAWFSYAPSKPSINGEEGNTVFPAGDTFLKWLPGWYEMVLNLLTEERRQAATVFGPTEAPDIVVKVLREVFRPILPTFQSRLETVVSSVATETGSLTGTKGSMETLCSIYESTLRFLSLTYDLVAGAFLDLVESGTSKPGDTGIELFRDLQGVFLQLASPFALYIQRFADLEAKHSSVSSGMVAKDIQQTVGIVSSSSSTMNLQTLQEATTRLKDLASFIFPIVDGSLDRFELLNGGYQAKLALTSVDKLLSNHLGELVMAVRSLSAATTAEASAIRMELASDFDEQHVLCAMEVLKMAGNFRRDLRNFETGTKNRMAGLADRMEDFLAQEANLEALSSSSKTNNDAFSFSLPDSLSMIEIDSFLTRVFCGESDKSTAMDNDGAITSHPSLVTLQEIASGEEMLYANAHDAVQRLASSCHSFVFDVCSAVPSKHLNQLSDMPVWSEAASTSDTLELSYGTLPQQYITQVGEHMLSLVQAFEPFAADPAILSLVNEVMEGVKDVALQAWSDFTGSTGYVGSEATIVSLMNGVEIVPFVLANASLGEEDAALEDGATQDEIASAAFCNVWLDAIGLAVTGRLLEKILRIPQLTSKGCDHLSADLNYLVNVFSALGVAGHPHPLVSHVAAIAKLSDSDLEAQIRGRDTSSELQSALRAMEARIALRRGISVG